MYEIRIATKTVNLLKRKILLATLQACKSSSITPVKLLQCSAVTLYKYHAQY